MTPNQFRRLALSLPNTVEAAHQGHPDFRVAGRIFASLGVPDAGWAMVRLTPEQQARVVAATPAGFVPATGAWGRRGYTNVRLAQVSTPAMRDALAMAWRNITSKATSSGIARGRGRKHSQLPDLKRAFARVRKVLRPLKLPDIEEGTSYGTPALKLRGKFIMRVKDPETLVFHCPVAEKQMLITAAPRIYFETDHYKGWPAVLVRLAKASDRELGICLRRAWRAAAPARLRSQYEAAAPAPRQRSGR